MSQKTCFIYITAILAIFLGLKVIHIVSLGNGADPKGDPAFEPKHLKSGLDFYNNGFGVPPNFTYLFSVSQRRWFEGSERTTRKKPDVVSEAVS
jgi:hypothetical protein